MLCNVREAKDGMREDRSEWRMGFERMQVKRKREQKTCAPDKDLKLSSHHPRLFHVRSSSNRQRVKKMKDDDRRVGSNGSLWSQLASR